MRSESAGLPWDESGRKTQGNNYPLFYIDTSALLKRYVPEDGTDFVDDLYEFEYSAGERLYTARHTITEFGSGTMRLMREGKFTKDEALGIIDVFSNECINLLRFLDLNDNTVNKSLDAVLLYPLKAADALHLAFASGIWDRAKQETKDFYFVCDDSALCTAGEKEGMHVLRPRDPGAKDEMKKIYSLFKDDL